MIEEWDEFTTNTARRNHTIAMRSQQKLTLCEFVLIISATKSSGVFPCVSGR